MPNKITDSLFMDSLASAKFFRTFTGSYRQYDDETTPHIVPYEHGLNDDQLYVVGWVKYTFSITPTQDFYNSLPFLDALGSAVAVATWDSTNVYMELPYAVGGSPSNYTDFEWTLLCVVA